MKATSQAPLGQPPASPSRWQMQKERLVKDDGRYLVYYRFVARPPDVAQPSHGATLQQEPK